MTIQLHPTYRYSDIIDLFIKQDERQLIQDVCNSREIVPQHHSIFPPTTHCHHPPSAQSQFCHLRESLNLHPLELHNRIMQLHALFLKELMVLALAGEVVVSSLLQRLNLRSDQWVCSMWLFLRYRYRLQKRNRVAEVDLNRTVEERMNNCLASLSSLGLSHTLTFHQRLQLHIIHFR
jgi:hypothetical protein